MNDIWVVKVLEGDTLTSSWIELNTRSNLFFGSSEGVEFTGDLTLNGSSIFFRNLKLQEGIYSKRKKIMGVLTRIDSYYLKNLELKLLSKDSVLIQLKKGD